MAGRTDGWTDTRADRESEGKHFVLQFRQHNTVFVKQARIINAQPKRWSNSVVIAVDTSFLTHSHEDDTHLLPSLT